MQKLHKTQEKIYELLSHSPTEGMSLREIASRVGVSSPNTVLHHIRRLEERGYIFRDKTNGEIRALRSPVADIVFVSVYGLAECGPTGMFTEDNVLDRIPLPAKTFKISPDSYLVEAVGDSMYPEIKEGDLVLAEKNMVAENGDLVVVIHNGTAKIKKFFKDFETGQVILQSTNPAFPPIGLYAGDELHVAGVVSGVVYKVKRRRDLGWQ
jgi:repressor LexA